MPRPFRSSARPTARAFRHSPSVFELVARAGADHVRFNIETKITPTSGAETPDPEAFAAAVATAVREAGLAARVSVQSFDWRTLDGAASASPRRSSASASPPRR